MRYPFVVSCHQGVKQQMHSEQFYEWVLPHISTNMQDDSAEHVLGHQR